MADEDEDVAPGYSHAIAGSAYSGGTWAAKVAVITGAGSGIGEAIAYAAADRGMSVVRLPLPAAPPTRPVGAAGLVIAHCKARRAAASTMFWGSIYLIRYGFERGIRKLLSTKLSKYEPF